MAVLELTSPAPPKTPDEELVELRLALVCFGGVSLAIYMHGVTKELHHLVIASAELEPPASRPKEQAGGVVPVYRELLEELKARGLGPAPSGVRTRVVVDILAGTSAGGINGVCLARALAGDASQDSLRALWLDKADIVQLLAPDVRERLPRIEKALPHLLALFPGLRKIANKPPSVAADGKLSRFWHWTCALRYLGRPGLELAKHFGGFASALDGGHMSVLCNEALTNMPARAEAGPAGTLMPPGLGLDLFVTITDFSGWKRYVPLSRRTVRDANFRHVLHFSSRAAADGSGRGDLAGDVETTRMLGFAARATASFPGAFPPVALGEFARDAVQDAASGAFGDAILSRFFRAYELDGSDASWRAFTEGRRFVDGGVLNNKPFDLAIAAIQAQPAANQVRRRLIYIEPDPDDLVTQVEAPPAPAAPPPVPALLRTLRQASSSIPLEDSIVMDVLAVRDRNEQVRRVHEIVQQNMAQIVQAVVDRIDGGPGGEGIVAGSGPPAQAWWRDVDESLYEKGQGTYVRIKIRSVVESFAAAICRLCDYPRESNQAFAVHEVVYSWAETSGLFDQQRDEPTPRQRRFLSRFDLGFRTRRVRFVIDGVSGLYPGSGEGHGDRAGLDDLKAFLYDRIAALDRAQREAVQSDEVARLTTGLFTPRAMSALLPPLDGSDAEQTPATFAKDSAESLDRLEQLVGEALEARLSQFNELTIAGILERLPKLGVARADQQALLARFVGFPRFDPITYPIRALTGVGERDGVELLRLSPLDGSLLGRYTRTEQKLKGVGINHFGAFFDRAYRENDYLWGRLDGAEQLIALLTEDAPPAERDELRTRFGGRALLAVLDEEGSRDGLEGATKDLIAGLRAKLPGASAPAQP